MKETLKRELNKTYLILSSGESGYEESYELQMIMRNAPETILPLHVRRVDEELHLFYDVSSKQTLSACAERAKISADTIRKLFESIERMFQEVQNYLLDMENIVLDLEHIYTKEGEFYFCYCPWEKQDVINGFRKMLEELLGKIDYHDTEGVELAYHFYQSACRGSVQIREILEEHRQETDAEEPNQMFWEESLRTAEIDSEKEHKEQRKLQEKDERCKKGFLAKIIGFFLKKEEPDFSWNNKEQPMDLIREEHAYKETVKERIKAEEEDASTVLVEYMPLKCWKLQPVLDNHAVFEITGESFVVGKKKESVDGYIARDTVSRIHSRLSVKQGRLFIQDANSTNGTYVNGEAIEPGQEVEIFQGDRILFADVGYECYNSL